MVRGSFVHCSEQCVRHRACSGAVRLASSPPSHPLFFSFPLFYQCDGCLEWGLMAGLRGFASHGAVFYLGAGWPQWKPLDIPGTLLPLKQGSWLKIFNIHKILIPIHFDAHVHVPKYQNFLCNSLEHV